MWQFLKTSNNIWHDLTISENIQQYPSTSKKIANIIEQYMKKSDNIWQYLKISDNI